jgi:hypothetical protein
MRKLALQRVGLQLVTHLKRQAIAFSVLPLVDRSFEAGCFSSRTDYGRTENSQYM